MEPNRTDEGADDSAAPPRLRRRRGLIAAGVAVGLVGVVSVQHLHQSQQGQPYPASAVHASVALSVVAPADAQQRLDALAGPGRLTAATSTANQVVVGQLSLTTPGNAPKAGQYSLFVVENDLHAPVPGMWGVGPVGSDVARGWDARYDAVVRTGASATGRGGAVSFPPRTHGPITFEATLAPNSAAITDPVRQLTVLLVFFALDGHVYWSQRLPA